MFTNNKNGAIIILKVIDWRVKNMQRTYLCIDLKTFYASVECVERHLDHFNTNLVVADPSRGKGAICLAISPKMKMLGIKNRCRIYEIPPTVKYIVALPRMKKYIEYSANIYAIYLKYFAKEDIHVYSIDEAFMDATNYLKMYNMTVYNNTKYSLKEEFAIIDNSKEFDCNNIEEEIYRDDEYIYYLPCEKSQYIKVIYAPNEYQEGLKSSLAEGNIKISDLDKFNIEYIKKEITN